MLITGRQCKAGRALLNWLQTDLAKASGIGVATIGAFEQEQEREKPASSGVSRSTVSNLCEALERAGVIFLEGEGVKLRTENTATYRGALACSQFFEQLAKESGDGVLAYIKSHDILARYCGEPRKTVLEWLDQIHAKAHIQCILADNRPVHATPAFTVKTVPNLAVSPASFFLYNNKLALLTLDALLDMNVLVIYESAIVTEYQESFNTYWKAMDMRLHVVNGDKSARARIYN